MVAAVLNPVGLDNTSKSMDDLKKVVNDYTTRIEKGEFVMFNSVYKDSNNGTEVCAVPIEAKHLQKTVDAAKANAVTIFVERSVAKVEVALDDKIGFDAKTNLLALKESGETPKPIIIDGQQVYLKLEGWSLTADNDNGRQGNQSHVDKQLVERYAPQFLGYQFALCQKPVPQLRKHRHVLCFCDVHQ